MKKFITHALWLALFLIFQIKTNAQVNPGLTVSGNQLTVTYAPAATYNTNPQNRWNSQVLTIRYPSAAAVTWSNFTNLAGFSYSEDPSTVPPVNGGDGFFYKIFSSSDVATLVNMTSGTNFNVFRIQVSAASNVTFELVESNAWTSANNGDAAVNNAATGNNEFGSVVDLGNETLDVVPPTATISSTAPNPTTTAPIPVTIVFSEAVTGFAASDLTVLNGSASALVTSDNITFTTNITPFGSGNVTVGLPANRCTDAAGNNNSAASNFSIAYTLSTSALATYLLEELNDGYYRVSLIAHTNWSGTNAITATAQVTIKAGTSTSAVDSFNITDLTMLAPGVTWAQNSRYNAPPENPNQDYISFGLTSYGTSGIAYVTGDTVPLFKFKNTGICSEDSVYLMPITGDPFAYPNSLNANVGQQLSVSGYNEPDVPLAVEGVASCMAEVTFDFKAVLQGAFSPSAAMMHDSLRALDLIPTTEPYTGYEPIRGSAFAPFSHADDGGGETLSSPSVLDATGANAIVDWVLIELRSQHDSTAILSTRAALLQRDGDIKDTTGTDYLVFRKLRSDKYFFTVRHRNHLGMMSEAEVPLVHTVNHYDFSAPDTALYGSNPGYILGTKRLMWAGNSNGDFYIMFQGGGIGEGLDIDNVFDNIFTDPENANFSYNHVRDGYYPGDNNLDGRVKYQGPANDVDPFIFFNIISRHPENIQKYVNYYINQRLPQD